MGPHPCDPQHFQQSLLITSMVYLKKKFFFYERAKFCDWIDTVLNKDCTQRILSLREQGMRICVSWAFAEILEKALDFHRPRRYIF